MRIRQRALAVVEGMLRCIQQQNLIEMTNLCRSRLGGLLSY
jgi:hypothetical protein